MINRRILAKKKNFNTQFKGNYVFRKRKTGSILHLFYAQFHNKQCKYCLASFLQFIFSFGLDFECLWGVNQPISKVDIRSIDKSSALANLSAICLVDMPKKMKLWPNFLYFLEQAFASSVMLAHSLVQDSIRRAVGDQNINVLWNAFPKVIGILLSVHKPPVVKLNRIRRTEYLNSLDLNRLMLKIGAYFFQFAYLFIWYHLHFGIFGLSGMIDLIKTKIMIACDDYLMLVRQHLQELPEPYELLFA